MLNLKMKSTKNVLHAVTGVTGITVVVGLHNFTNYESVLKFMITDDNKQLCYYDAISHVLKKNM